MITFNILGGCVSRDIFSRPAHGNKYKVNRYTRGFSPLFCLDPGLEIDRKAFDAIDSTKLSNFSKRALYIELTHSVFDFLLEGKSDYLLLDTGMFRIPYAKLANGQYILAEALNAGFIKALLERKMIPQIVEKLAPDFLDDDEFKSRVVRYADRIKTLYTTDRIILMNHGQNRLYWDKKKKAIGMYNNFRKRYETGDKMMKHAFELLKNELAGCHVINYLPNAIADRWHPLGANPMHFTIGYYEYCLECIDIIVRNLPWEEEEKAISKNRDRWNRKYAQVYYPHVARYCILLKEKLECDASLKSSHLL